MNNKAGKIHPCAEASWFSFARNNKKVDTERRSRIIARFYGIN